MPAGSGSAARGGVGFYLLLAYAGTLPTLVIAEPVASSADLIALLKLLCLAAFGWHAATVLRGRRERWSKLGLAAATGLIWSAVLAIAGYKRLAMAPLDFAMVLLSLDEAGRTLEHVLGRHGIAIVVAALIVLVLAAVLVALAALRGARTIGRRLPAGAALLCVPVLCYLAAADAWYAAGELVLYPRSYDASGWYRTVPPWIPDYSASEVRSSESVIILQLESVSSLALFQPTADGTAYRARVAQPGLQKILEEGRGVFFPRFWSNGAQTNRAWESILCGVSGNLGPPMASDPARLSRRTCLPEHLARAGYATVFLYSYFDTEFFNLGGFARFAGFQDVAYGPKLMREGDPRYDWGYDDCVFYERAFDYLAAHALDRRQRLFAYFEVGTNHALFYNSMKHPQAHPYPAPSGFVQHYLNSVAEQDYCLLTFWKRFRQLRRDDVHLFIVPDHSLWVGHGVDEEDAPFAIWLAYVPPRRAAGFARGPVLSPQPSQAELYPTVLELLGAQRSRRSFAFALRGDPRPTDYDDCRLLSEPHLRLVVHRDGQRAEFRFADRSGDFQRFRERFGCPR